MEDEWCREALLVFEGDFTKTSDQNDLVITVLGLWAMVLRNLREPNFNTFLAGLGVVAAVLQQVLTFDVLDARHHLRGLVGGNLPDFTNRLQNVALGLFCVAAFARFE